MSLDITLDIVDKIKESGYDYILAVFHPQKENKKNDEVVLYTSFENQDLNKLSEVLKKAKPAKAIKKPKLPQADETKH